MNVNQAATTIYSFCLFSQQKVDIDLNLEVYLFITVPANIFDMGFKQIWIRDVDNQTGHVR